MSRTMVRRHGRAPPLPRRDPEGVAQQVRVGRGARRRSSSTASCSPRSSTRRTTASSPTRWARTATRSTRWSASPSRPFPGCLIPVDARRRLPHVRRQGPGRQDPLRPARGPQLERAARALRPARPAARGDRALLLDLQAAGGQGGRGRRLVRARRGAADHRARAGSAGGRRAPDAGRRAPGRAPRSPSTASRGASWGRTGRGRARRRTCPCSRARRSSRCRRSEACARACSSASGSDERHLALACASHGGSPAHVAVVAEVLEATGLVEGALGCGPELPLDPRAAAARAPSRIRHNCSGKHAFGLARCLAGGLAARRLLPRRPPAAGRDARLRGRGVRRRAAPTEEATDGCGMRTFAGPLRALAGAFGGLASGGRARRATAARRRCARTPSSSPTTARSTRS